MGSSDTVMLEEMIVHLMGRTREHLTFEEICEAMGAETGDYAGGSRGRVGSALYALQDAGRVEGINDMVFRARIALVSPRKWRWIP